MTENMIGLYCQTHKVKNKKKLSHTCEEAEELTAFPFYSTNILTFKQCSINLKKCKLDESEKEGKF